MTMPILTLWHNNTKKEIPFEEARLGSPLQELCYAAAHPCGGREICGKCAIRAEGSLSRR